MLWVLLRLRLSFMGYKIEVWNFYAGFGLMCGWAKTGLWMIYLVLGQRDIG